MARPPTETVQRRLYEHIADRIGTCTLLGISEMHPAPAGERVPPTIRQAAEQELFRKVYLRMSVERWMPLYVAPVEWHWQWAPGAPWEAFDPHTYVFPEGERWALALMRCSLGFGVIPALVLP